MTDLSKISGIGQKTIDKLEKLGIFNTSDLLNHFPLRYIDFSHISTISSAPINENVTLSGTIVSFNSIFSRYGKNLQKAVLRDSTGSVNLIWFNQPFLSKTIKIGTNYLFAGSITLYKNQKTIIAPVHGLLNTGRIVSVYPQTAGLGSTWFRKTLNTNLKTFIKSVDEILPQNIITKYHLLTLPQAYLSIHQPPNSQQLEKAHLRLTLQELLALQANTYLLKKQWLSSKPQFILKRKSEIKNFIKDLPFILTSSQLLVWQEIENDLISTSKVTNRLLQGDVGSGKTIVVILASLLAYLNHHQTIIIAPTQILARQHLSTFTTFLNHFKINIKLLSSTDKLTPDQIKKADILIATHAALFKKPQIYEHAALVIFDEQHKFGVKQRTFFNNLTHQPHLITMTATPIPRTISLTLLGNLDLSYIDQLPQNRLPIKTFLVPQAKQPGCFQWLKKEIISTHHQAFIVCPFIESSENNLTIKAAKVEYEILSKDIFPNLKLALIHGLTKPTDRQRILSDFQENKINILVTTPIIEVGIDYPNATVIIIQSAQRFGLAQLHQLRGRVGRGDQQSYCYLFAQEHQQLAQSRLQFLSTHHSGLQIAEYDLKIRGPGELFSFLQHGFPSLKLADITNAQLLKLSSLIINDLLATHPDFDLTLLTKKLFSTLPN